MSDVIREYPDGDICLQDWSKIRLHRGPARADGAVPAGPLHLGSVVGMVGSGIGEFGVRAWILADRAKSDVQGIFPVEVASVILDDDGRNPRLQINSDTAAWVSCQGWNRAVGVLIANWTERESGGVHAERRELRQELMDLADQQDAWAAVELALAEMDRGWEDAIADLREAMERMTESVGAALTKAGLVWAGIELLKAVTGRD